MQRRIKLFLGLVSACASMGASAQVVNGDFSAGYGGWTLRDATFVGSSHATCAGSGYQTSTRGTVKGAAPASGRVAVVTPRLTYAPGTWLLCSELEQTVYVPMGKQLKFVTRIGEGIYDSPYLIEPGNLSVVIVDGAKSATLFSQRGYNVECMNGQWPCPAYRHQVVDLSPYWGKTVRLIFRGSSTIQNGQLGGISYPSNAYLDSVRFE